MSLLLAFTAAWSMKEIVDPMTDEPRYVLQNNGDAAAIALKCDKRGGVIYAGLYLDRFIGLRYRDVQFQYRVDDAKAKRDLWWGKDRSATNLKPSEFINDLRGGTKLTIRIKNYDGLDIDKTFDITGSDEAIGELQAACAGNPQP